MFPYFFSCNYVLELNVLPFSLAKNMALFKNHKPKPLLIRTFEITLQFAYQRRSQIELFKIIVILLLPKIHLFSWF